MMQQETHKQCSVCGLAGTSIKDPCGTCKRLGMHVPYTASLRIHLILVQLERRRTLLTFQVMLCEQSVELLLKGVFIVLLELLEVPR
jgi:hypothetical protein